MFLLELKEKKSYMSKITVFTCGLAGLSRRVIVKDAETGRTQTYSVGSDVLAQQFALRVRRL